MDVFPLVWQGKGWEIYKNTNLSDLELQFRSDLSPEWLLRPSGESKQLCQGNEVIPLVSNSVHLFQEFSGSKCKDLNRRGKQRQIATCN